VEDAVRDRHAKVALGRVVATPGVLEGIPNDDVLAALRCHANGDWGEVGKEDWQANDDAVVAGARVLSSYRSRNGTRFWIITEADRSATTVLLPQEY
jgi:hypothetical protein